MLAILHLLGTVITNLFKSRRRLEAREPFSSASTQYRTEAGTASSAATGSDRAVMVWLTWLWPSLIRVARVVEPDTILRWHRAGFRAYWRWRSRGQPGRPKIERELRDLIQQMSKENPLWGAPRIHGELLKLGFEIAELTVSKYMVKRRGPPSQSWRTFLRNHADAIAAIDLCVVPHYVRVSVCVSRRGPWSTTATVVRGDPASDGRMAGATDRRGIPVGHGTAISNSRQ